MSDIAKIQSHLLAWYEKNKRDLPWRRTKNSYAVWVSEIMLQQTQVDTVIPYYERWMKKFPSVNELADASLDDVLRLWEGLGYYSRARNLYKGAQYVVHEAKGRIPSNTKGLQELPGIGPYTARAIASIVFDEDAAVVDGNVKRVLSRIFLMKEEGNSFQEKADEVLAKGRAGDFNQAMMELGAVICTPQNPSCLLCPVGEICEANKKNLQNEFPVKKTRVQQKKIKSLSAIIWKDDKVLIRQRPQEGLLGGLWEFPTFSSSDLKIGEKEMSIFIKKNSGIQIKIGNIIGNFNHIYTHLREDLAAYECHWKSGNIPGKMTSSWKWVMPGQLLEFPFSGIAGKVRRKILEITAAKN